MFISMKAYDKTQTQIMVELIKNEMQEQGPANTNAISLGCQVWESLKLFFTTKKLLLF